MQQTHQPALEIGLDHHFRLQIGFVLIAEMQILSGCYESLVSSVANKELRVERFRKGFALLLIPRRKKKMIIFTRK
jgi:hypothetical protein